MSDRSAAASQRRHGSMSVESLTSWEMLVENSETQKRLAEMMPEIKRESLLEYALTRTVWEILKNGLLTLWFFAIHLFDIGSDIWVARRHYKDGNYGYLSATLTFVIVPAIIASFFSLRWYCSDVKERGKRKSKWLIILHCLHFGPLISYWEGYKYSIKRSRTPEGKIELVFLKKQAYSDAANLRLIEAFMESIPQCILQIFIISSDHRHQTTVTPAWNEAFIADTTPDPGFVQDKTFSPAASPRG